MRIVVLGSTGMAGNVVSTYLEEQGHEIFRASRSEKNTEKSAAIDVTDFAALGSLLDRLQFDVVINCIGLLQRSCDERPDLAVLVNAYLPRWLERRFKESTVRIIHLSTDCVFSGERGGYKEDDITDGMTIYDRSKALGELHNSKDLTLRMSIIGPDIDPHGTGLFNWFMAQRGEIQGWKTAIWNGVATTELARAINAALSTGLSGLYHLVPASSIDKYSLLKLMKDTFQRDDVKINGTDNVALNKSLVSTRTDFDFAVRDYSEQLADMKRWIEEHKEFYPHYFI